MKRGLPMLRSFLLMADIQATQLVFLLAGVVLRRRDILSDGLRSGLSALMIQLFLPCMVLDSFHQDISHAELLGALALVGVSALLCGVSMGIGKLAFRRCPKERGSVLRYGTMIPNAGFAGISLMRDAYGPMGAFYSSMFVIPIRACIWSIGVALFSSGAEPHRVRKILLNPCLVAVYIGLIRLITHFSLPAFLDHAISSIGECCTSVSMIFIGGVLADTNIRGLFSRELFRLALLRLIVLPGLTLLLLRLLGFNAMMTATAVVLMGMPVAATTTVLAARYGADAGFAAQSMLVTTVLSLITIPLWAALL